MNGQCCMCGKRGRVGGANGTLIDNGSGGAICRVAKDCDARRLGPWMKRQQKLLRKAI